MRNEFVNSIKTKQKNKFLFSYSGLLINSKCILNALLTSGRYFWGRINQQLKSDEN